MCMCMGRVFRARPTDGERAFPPPPPPSFSFLPAAAHHCQSYSCFPPPLPSSAPRAPGKLSISSRVAAAKAMMGALLPLTLTPRAATPEPSAASAPQRRRCRAAAAAAAPAPWNIAAMVFWILLLRDWHDRREVEREREKKAGDVDRWVFLSGSTQRGGGRSRRDLIDLDVYESSSI